MSKIKDCCFKPWLLGGFPQDSTDTTERPTAEPIKSSPDPTMGGKAGESSRGEKETERMSVSRGSVGTRESEGERILNFLSQIYTPPPKKNSMEKVNSIPDF